MRQERPTPRTRVVSAIVAAILLATTASARAETKVAPSAPNSFDSRVAAAKTAMVVDPQIALARSLEALAIARGQAGDPKQAEHIATAQWLQGEALLRLNQLDAAGPVIAQGLAVAAARLPNSKLHGDLTLAQAEVKAMQGDVQAALSSFQAAYRIYGKTGYLRGQAMALQNIGSIYQEAGDYQKVMQYYAQSADLYPADPSLAVSAHNNIGRALQLQNRYPEAAVELGKALDLAREMQSPQLEASILENLAAVEVQWGHLDQAQVHLNAALKLTQTDPSARESQPWVWGVGAQVQLARHQPAAAAQLLARMFQGADLAKTTMAYRDFHETAYEAFSQLGDEHQALAHLKAFKRLDDEARTLAASTNAALMSAQFDFANQASRIAQLKAGQLQRDIKLARSRNLISNVLLIGSVAVAILLLVSFLWIRRSRNQVREANRSLEKALKARTEFLATTSHEIRTPLNGILGMTQVILAGRRLDPDLREQIALVHDAGETMRALVDDILDIAKIENDGVTLNRAELDLRTLCEEITRQWAERAGAKGLTLSLDVGAAAPSIVEDAGRLRQILFNLLSNAIKFTERGGVILSARIETVGDAEALLLAVTDTGIGIPPDKLEDVFESFRQVDGSITRTYQGTGLGLAICRRLARAMGGDVFLESVLGQGSTVTVRLPLERAAGHAEDDPEAPRTLNDCRLLVCDANPLSQAMIKAVLGPQARAIEAVASCEAAEDAAASGRFDLVLIDASALGLEREARLAGLRALTATVSPALVAVMTADVTDDETRRLLGAGAAQIIRKPIAAAALAGELRDGFTARLSIAARAARATSMINVR